MIWIILLICFPALVILARATRTPTIEEQDEKDRARELKAQEYYEYYGALAKAWAEEYERLKETE